MAVKIKVPTSMREVLGNEATLEVQFKGRMIDLLNEMAGAHPGLSSHLFENGSEVKSYLSFFKNDRDVRGLGGMETQVEDGDEIFILSPIAGG